jgi:hypothetical protein
MLKVNHLFTAKDNHSFMDRDNSLFRVSRSFTVRVNPKLTVSQLDNPNFTDSHKATRNNNNLMDKLFNSKQLF